MYFCLVFLIVILYFHQLFMAVLTIYFLVETVRIDTMYVHFLVLVSILLVVLLPLISRRYTYVLVEMLECTLFHVYFFSYSRCNPVLIHYRCAGTYIISRTFFVYSSVISYYSIIYYTSIVKGLYHQSKRGIYNMMCI